MHFSNFCLISSKTTFSLFVQSSTCTCTFFSCRLHIVKVIFYPRSLNYIHLLTVWIFISICLNVKMTYYCCVLNKDNPCLQAQIFECLVIRKCWYLRGLDIVRCVTLWEDLHQYSLLYRSVVQKSKIGKKKNTKCTVWGKRTNRKGFVGTMSCAQEDWH